MDDLDDECGGVPRVAAVARAPSWSGEHGAVWPAGGPAGAAVDRERCGAWLRAVALTAPGHLASVDVKRRKGRRHPPAMYGLAVVNR
jgi:hypothetical protein